MDKQKLQDFLKKMQSQCKDRIDNVRTPNSDVNVIRTHGAFSAYEHIEILLNKGFFDNGDTEKRTNESVCECHAHTDYSTRYVCDVCRLPKA